MAIQVLVHTPEGELVKARKNFQPILSKVKLDNEDEEYLRRHERQLNWMSDDRRPWVRDGGLSREDHEGILLNYYRRLKKTGAREVYNPDWNNRYWRATVERNGSWLSWYAGAPTGWAWKSDSRRR